MDSGSSLISIILVVDFILLGIVFLLYLRFSYKERNRLRKDISQALDLQQKIYQIEVLKEISDRIGYSLDTNKIIEIITSSLGNLLEYDAVSYMVLGEEDKIVFKCHIENTVNHKFVEQVKDKMLLSLGAILNRPVINSQIDESLTGNILDDNLDVEVVSFFNLPVVISGKLVGLITVASSEAGLYGERQASILYSITNQAASAVSKLQTILASEKGKLTSIIYSMTDGVIMVNKEHQVSVSNPAVKEILQIFGEKDITMYDIVDALAGHVDLRTKVDQAILEHQPIVIPGVLVKDRAIELVITPVRTQEGEQLGAAVVFHDVTTEKSLEKLRQEFTAMMVHELRAPLTAVRWSSESILGGLKTNPTAIDPKKLQDSLNTVHAASSSMLELVNDLLDVAKIEAGKFELNIQEYDLVTIVGEQVKAFGPLADSKHLNMNFTAPQKLSIKCDRVRIAQVLNNLLSNSVKYTDSGQIDVNIEVDSVKHQAVVSVKDTGIGVSREDLPKLFSKFKQLESAQGRKGTGLGLVVCKGIMEAHGGDIGVESAGENLGSTFKFSLPL